MSNASIYEMVTNKIIEKLESGIIPWRMPWVNGGAVNWKTQKAYRGINAMLLDEGEYATFNQIKEAGGKVKKGAKSSIIVFWKWLEKEDADGEIEKIPFLKYYRVFEINTQVEGLNSKRKSKSFDHDPIEEAEKIYKGYLPKGPDFTFHKKGAWYKPSLDLINVNPIKDFTKAEEFYSTLFHEMIHSTGAASRLNREGVTGTIKFGSEDYSKEELVAEFGAAMLCGVAGIENRTVENSTAYIQSWLSQLKTDKTLLVRAAGQAQKAADYILGTTFEDVGE